MRAPHLIRLAPVAVLYLLANGGHAAANSAPVVTNVEATQIAGTGQVRVTYDCSDADGDDLTARLVCSSDGGTTFDLLPSTLSGDVNITMAPGSGKMITWQASIDYPGRYWSQVVAKVIVTDGPSLSGEMVFIPGGTFTMGKDQTPSSSPSHSVTLGSYYIDKFEVSNADFQRFIDAGGYSTQAFWSSDGWIARGSNNWTAPVYWGDISWRNGPGWPGFPVGGVSYYEAEAYAAFAGKRLPTEAEWERAARGTGSEDYPWGSGLLASRANFYGSGDPFETGTSPVGFFDGRLHPNPPYQTTNSPSPVGAYDMSGNVNEWVRDWFEAYPPSGAPQTNPLGPLTGVYKVVRGGSFMGGYTYEGIGSLTTWERTLTVANYPNGGSTNTTPLTRSLVVGFRCARTAP